MWIHETLSDKGYTFTVQCEGFKGIVNLASFDTFQAASEYIKLNRGIELC